MSSRKTMNRIGLIATFACAALIWATSASAASFTLDQSNCCAPGPFGTVDVTQAGANLVNVLVTLTPNVGFINTGSGNHPGFAWNLSGAPSLLGAITIIQDGGHDWTLFDTHSSPTGMSDGLGTYQYALNCDCGPGGSDPDFGPLEFTIALSGITPSSFVSNAAGTLFASDIINQNASGNPTGMVWTPEIVRVPEPATMWLLGAGLASLFASKRRQAVS